MYPSTHDSRKRSGILCRFALFLSALLLFGNVLSSFPVPSSQVAADTTVNDRRLLNGSFEEGQTWTDSYSQPDQSKVPYWNTTAFQGKIELFRKNTGVYIKNVTLEPTNGTCAAELNADEESTLYQNVKTSPSSVYEWGVDHGGRNGTDTMALVIGPKQSVDPSKPNKEGRDQLMQMVDWLIEKGETSVKTSAGLGESLTVYSKKFAAGGAFEDNAGNNAFSLTPSTIYTEQWRIWIMASSMATTGTNPWNSYGSNAEGSAGSETGEGDTQLDLNKYYLYTVPAGQTETIFGFVSVGVHDSTAPEAKRKTYGNFLDNINFQLYHPLSGSTTNHGSAIISGSDGSTGGTGNPKGHEVTVDNQLTTYVTDGEPLKIQAIVKQADAVEGCEFIGMYYSTQDADGNPVTAFLRLEGNVIEDNGELTDEDKAGKWVKSINAEGDIVYTYHLDSLIAATDLHFVFIKSPTITYDPNGGLPYEVERTYNTDEAANVYSFKPAANQEGAEIGAATIFIPPYVSHAAVGQNDGWKFIGWQLTGDIVDDAPTDIQVNADQLGTMILPAAHTIACDYMFDGVNGDSKIQYFKIYNGNVPLTEDIQKNSNDVNIGAKWNDNGKTKVYANAHMGLTLVAQWRWRQAFIPQTLSGGVCSDSTEGGRVEITSITDASDENYNGTYTENGGIAYHAATNEIVTVHAIANEGWKFIGWYDEKGNLVSINEEYGYIETKESVKTYYAKFKDSVTQTYIRQINYLGGWKNTDDDAVAILGRYSYTDAVGMPISSTAMTVSGSDYKFVGWYDSNGNPVPEDMLTNDGMTISYITTEDATYYARFSNLVVQTYIRQVNNGAGWKNTSDNTIGTLDTYRIEDEVKKTASSAATAGTGYKFVGWYDANGNKVPDSMLTDDGGTISYITSADATYYARFAKLVTQTYIRQIKNGDTWEEITDDAIGMLDSYGFTDAVGMTASSEATAGSGYGFVGWYDADGNPVPDAMLRNDGLTLSYITTEDATYYARFEKRCSLQVSKIDGDASTAENPVPLPGAEFTLYQQSDSGDQTIVYDDTNITCIAVAVAITVMNSDNTMAIAVFTDKLAHGTDYYLAETKAPSGYRLLDAPLKITIDSSGNAAMIDSLSKELTDNMLSIELANYLTLHMPSSGSMMTGSWLAAVGLLLMAAAATGLFGYQYRRMRRTGK